MRRHWIVALICLAALAASLPALGAVRTAMDRDSDYRVNRQMQTGGRDSVGDTTSRGDAGRSLHAFGNRNGDVFPIIRDNRVAPHHPWVVWSRFNQVQYDLAWSRWTGTAWEPVRWLDPRQQTIGDSLDADLSFDDSGRPYVAWWRDEGGTGRIYFSLFLKSNWMQSMAVSVEGTDSRYPTIEAVGSDRMVVRYETDTGTVEQTVYFIPPVTITDDINPLDFVHSTTLIEVEAED